MRMGDCSGRCRLGVRPDLPPAPAPQGGRCCLLPPPLPWGPLSEARRTELLLGADSGRGGAAAAPAPAAAALAVGGGAPSAPPGRAVLAPLLWTWVQSDARYLRVLSCRGGVVVVVVGRLAMLLGTRGVTAGDPAGDDSSAPGVLLPAEPGGPCWGVTAAGVVCLLVLLLLLRGTLAGTEGRGHRSGVTLPVALACAAAAAAAVACPGLPPAAAMAAATRSEGVRFMPGWFTCPGLGGVIMRL